MADKQPKTFDERMDEAQNDEDVERIRMDMLLEIDQKTREILDALEKGLPCVCGRGRMHRSAPPNPVVFRQDPIKKTCVSVDESKLRCDACGREETVDIPCDTLRINSEELWSQLEQMEKETGRTRFNIFEIVGISREEVAMIGTPLMEMIEQEKTRRAGLN